MYSSSNLEHFYIYKYGAALSKYGAAFGISTETDPQLFGAFLHLQLWGGFVQNLHWNRSSIFKLFKFVFSIVDCRSRLFCGSRFKVLIHKWCCINLQFYWYSRVLIALRVGENIHFYRITLMVLTLMVFMVYNYFFQWNSHVRNDIMASFPLKFIHLREVLQFSSSWPSKFIPEGRFSYLGFTNFLEIAQGDHKFLDFLWNSFIYGMYGIFDPQGPQNSFLKGYIHIQGSWIHFKSLRGPEASWFPLKFIHLLYVWHVWSSGSSKFISKGRSSYLGFMNSFKISEGTISCLFST